MTMAQLPLNLGLGFREAFGREDFLVTKSNLAAVSWLDKWPNWSGHCLIVYGDEGCGKTHLAHVFMDKTGSKTPLVDAKDLQEAAIPDLVALSGSVALENAGSGINEAALLHLYNFIKDNNGFLFITAKNPPALWDLKLPDLSSRIAASAAVEISLPDDDLMKALIIKMLSDRQMTISPEALEFMIRNIERSFGEARRIVARADSLALAERKGITIPILRKVLGK
ncbi:MAG: DNA replication protein [Alphaproteobacteria bacterium]|nr:DNA replication protein [Alphaproteobacteria bacterium]